MAKLKVNDTVKWRGGFGAQSSKKVKVTEIEINCDGKYGDDVDSVDWSKVNSRSVVVR